MAKYIWKDKIMEQIEFENGSKIETIETDGECIKSKRGQEQIQKISEYYKYNPDKFVEEIMGVKLFLHQKMLLKAMSAVDNIKVRLLKRRFR